MLVKSIQNNDVFYLSKIGMVNFGGKLKTERESESEDIALPTGKNN